ncbi:hypothetical protein CVT26_012734 [Gymnopilus dilepis]|uniref:Pyrroline-5-carboxylate reductase n=1 Tax=Gymnopilus dilepis TaxID=231916 RepID=A0A409WDN6_9AGAR|nr:hypothetical protein CVT26_012734 [Gymnopilus dilepis]
MRCLTPLIGCGTMGIAILSGVIDSLHASPIPNGSQKWESHTPGTLTPVPDATVPSQFSACVSREESAVKLRKIFGSLGELGQNVQVLASRNLEAVQNSDVVILCCKPQLAHTVLSEPGIKEALDGKLLISILAGVTMKQLTNWVLPTTRVVRAMPNTPCKIREGMTVVSNLPASEHAESDRSVILKIFSSIGRCRFLDEKHFDACTALSGSGPAFACIFMEAMADGGVMMGLPRAEALELAAQTLQGAARMVLQGGSHPAQIKDSVTTPGGCTIAGLLALEDGRVRSTIARGIQIATERASELGQPPTKLRQRESSMSQTEVSAVTLLIVIGSAVILTTLVGLYICTCYRSSFVSPRLRRLNRTSSTPSQHDSRHSKHLIYSADETNPSLCGIGAILGRRLHRSNSLPESIKISASRPTIFGAGEDEERSMRVVLTPPTPSKNEAFSSISPVDEIEEVKNSHEDAPVR